MPVPLPNLDDRTYDELVDAARSLIPVLAKDKWTNHNPSDPGIAIIELLAWLTEMLLYQVNELRPEHQMLFLKLLNGPDWHEADLHKAIDTTLETLRAPYRAVTARDYENLVGDVRARFAADPPVAVTDQERVELAHANRVLPTLTVRRVRCVPGNSSGHVDVVVSWKSTVDEIVAEDVVRALEFFLADRRTLTTQPHVVIAQPVAVRVRAVLALRRDTTVPAAVQEVADEIKKFLDPWAGGPDGTGWPFGRPVYTSDLYAVLRDIASVDYAESVALGRDGNEADPVVLAANEVVAFGGIDLSAYDSLGDVHSWSAEGS